jgi:hypothetical protein
MFVGAHVAKTPSIAASAILSSISALGLMTMPSMAFPIAGIYLWLVCLLLLNGSSLKRILCAFVIPCAIMTVGFSAVLYSPVIFVSNGLEPLLANEFVQSQPSEVFFGQTYPHFARTLAHYSRDIPGLILLFCLILMVMGIYSAARTRNWPILLLLPSVLVASGLIFLLKHAVPFPRTWIYMIPIVLLIADAGFTHCIEKLSSRFQFFVNQGMVLAGVFFAVFLVSTNAIVRYPDTSTFPEAPLVASYLKAVMNDGDRVYAMFPADYPTYFYLWYQGLRDFRDKGKAEKKAERKRKFFVVQKSTYPVEDATGEHEDASGEHFVKLIEVADVAIYRSRAHERAERS